MIVEQSEELKLLRREAVGGVRVPQATHGLAAEQGEHEAGAVPVFLQQPRTGGSGRSGAGRHPLTVEQ